MRFKPLPLLLLALLGAGDAVAIGLGEITILSRLGERFRAEVQLIESVDDKYPLAECFRLSQPIDPDTPVLNQGRVAVEGRGGKRRLLISSEQTINDPVLQLSLHAGCGAEIVRNYSVLIDPATEVLAQASAKKPAGPAAVPTPTGTRLQAPERRPPAAESPPATAPAAGAEPVPAGPPRLPRKKSASLRFPAEGRLAYRLVVSGDDGPASAPAGDLSLRLASELNTQRSDKTSDGQRAIFRIEYKLLSALYERTSEQLDLAEQVRNLESSLTELQAATGNSVRAAAPPGTSLAPAATEQRSALPPAAAQTRRAENVAAAGENSVWWLELAALLGLIALLAWALRQRSLRPQIARQGYGAEVAKPPPLSIPPVAEPAAADKPSTVVETPPGPPTIDDTLVAPALPLDANRRQSAHSQGTTVVAEANDFNPVMELADIMLSFGRLKGAAQALQEYIAQNPSKALQPWLKLLEIYRQGGMRQDFESLVAKLKLHFNVAPAAWEDASGLPQTPATPADETAASFEALLPLLPNIGRLQHICDRLAQSWDSPACLTYLNRLLRNNRNGQRRGFGPAEASELLFLIGLLERRLHD